MRQENTSATAAQSIYSNNIICCDMYSHVSCMALGMAMLVSQSDHHSTLKFLSNYWVDFHKIIYICVPQRMNPNHLVSFSSTLIND